MSTIVAQLGLLGVAIVTMACVSSDHDALAERGAPAGGSSGAGGATHDAAPDAPTDAFTDRGDEPPPPIAPDGVPAFSVIHGLVDAPVIRLCFASRSSEGQPFAPLDDLPLPEASAGLPFGHFLNLHPLLSAFDPALADLRPFVLCGPTDVLARATCSVLDAPPEGLQVVALAVIPAGTLSRGRSVLLIPTGCVGGADHVDSAQESVCGKGYAPDRPTVTTLLTSLDRATMGGRYGVQAFGASAASPTLLLRYVASGVPLTTHLASGIDFGTLTPRPPNYGLTPVAQGPQPFDDKLELVVQGEQRALATVKLGEALARGGRSVDDFVASANYAIVLLGAGIGVGAGPWWNSFTLSVIPSDP